MAKFAKGTSGNPAGRPKGAKNKSTTELRRKVQQLVEDNWDELLDRLTRLDDDKYVAEIRQLMEYVLPKLQRTDATVSAEVKVPRIVWSDEKQDGD